MREIKDLREALAHLDAGREAVDRLTQAEILVKEYQATVENLSNAAAIAEVIAQEDADAAE
jgi:hypothetical protein